ncbi:hypothetical protein PR202_ga18640 [Eleusine coracana subsp. coracana]|uniref:Uncharacterized protein n=1 Tax=Eleusine coracana subsp. coracana TaxID=191504 RepID=A0AAV5CUC2_ELECO|nr:hypothetical protein PR202_ga18640 [Eleusine coracana subsp. coracana]
MSLKLPLPQGFSFLRSVGWFEDRKADSAARQHLSPTLKLQTDKEVYRPGDSVTVTIEISSPATLKDDARQTVSGEDVPSLLLDSLSFELKGIEKLDSQWFSVPKPLPGPKQRRGERLFLDSSAPSLVSKVEARVPLQIRVSQKSSTLLSEEGTLPLSVDQLAIFWREKDEDSEWTKANDNTDLEEGYDSSKDEVSSFLILQIGGALTFFHGTGTRRCLEVSITLETSETINPRALHPSRRSSPTITKVVNYCDAFSDIRAVVYLWLEQLKFLCSYQ